MIILDTNQLDQVGLPNGPLLAMLSKIGKDAGHALAVPEIVLTEHLAHHWHKIDENIRMMARAARQLSNLLGKVVGHETFSRDEVCNARKRIVESAFVVLPTPDGAEREALRREAFRDPPAKPAWPTGGKRAAGSGARDVVIWLTILDAAKGADEDIIFVSADGDFVETDELRRELADEFHDIVNNSDTNLRIYNNITKLLEVFAHKIDPPDGDRMNEILSNDSVFQKIMDESRVPLLFFNADLDDIPSMAMLSGEIEFKLITYRNPIAYKVGENTWISAHVTLTGSKTNEYFVKQQLSRLEGSVTKLIEFSIDSTLLLRFSSEGSPDDIEVVGASLIKPLGVERRISDSQQHQITPSSPVELPSTTLILRPETQ